MDKTSFFAEIAEILEVKPASVTGDAALAAIGNWDSLAVITFVAMVDRAFGTIIEGEKLHKAKTPDDLAALVGL